MTVSADNRVSTRSLFHEKTGVDLAAVAKVFPRADRLAHKVEKVAADLPADALDMIIDEFLSMTGMIAGNHQHNRYRLALLEFAHAHPNEGEWTISPEGGRLLSNKGNCPVVMDVGPHKGGFAFFVSRMDDPKHFLVSIDMNTAIAGIPSLMKPIAIKPHIEPKCSYEIDNNFGVDSVQEVEELENGYDASPSP